MPPQVKAVPDERLVSVGVYELDPELPLVASQVGILLGRSKSRVEGDRRDNKPPPSYLDGRKVLYRLGDVLAERARIQGITPAQARESARQRVRHGARNFSGFLGTARLEDTWPIATVRGCPMDFFETLGMSLEEDELGEIADMSLGQFLAARLAFAARGDA